MQKMRPVGVVMGHQGHRNYAAILYRFRDTAQHDGKMNKLLQ